MFTRSCQIHLKGEEERKKEKYLFLKFRVEPVENFGSHRKTLKTLSFILFFWNFYFSQNGKKKWKVTSIRDWTKKKIKVTEVRRTFAWLWLFKKEERALVFLSNSYREFVGRGIPIQKNSLERKGGLVFFVFHYRRFLLCAFYPFVQARLSNSNP